MASATTAVSFSGIFSGVQSDQLITAILAQEGLPLQRLQARQTANTKLTTAINSFSSNLASLSSSLSTISTTSFDTRSVTSSDPNNSYLSATASGTAVGSYDLKVTQIATKARIAPAQDPAWAGPVDTNNLAVANAATTAIFTGGGPVSFGIQGTDGNTKTITLTAGQNNLNALRDAINASGANVTASVVNIGKGTTPYQLVITSKDTGTGVGTGVISLAELGGATNTIGIGTAPDATNLSTGLKSAAAVDAIFTLNGIELTRKTNVVTDAVDGMTLILKQGQQTTATTLTVSQDNTAITSALQDVVSKYNTMITAFHVATAVTVDASGNKTPGVFTGDTQIRTIVDKVRSTLAGLASGLSGGATLQSAAGIGLKTNSDGSLTLDTTVLKAALDKDPDAVKAVFTNASNGGVAQLTKAAIDGVTAPAVGTLAKDLQRINDQNRTLSNQINTWQERLARRKDVLTAQFTRMESAVSQIQSAASSLSKLG